MEEVPILDLHADLGVQVETVDRALRTFGFFYVKNHGLEMDIESQFEASHKFFNLPDIEKNTMPFDSQLDIGYVGPHGQNLDPSLVVQNEGTTEGDDNEEVVLTPPSDTKEQFMQTNNCLITAGPDPRNTPTIDPENVFASSQNYKPQVPGYDYSTVTGRYASKAYRLNQRLNNLLFDALQLDKEERQSLAEQAFIVLKQMKYAGEVSDPSRGKFGAGAHTDWGSFTILATDQTPGLQIYHDDEWIPIIPKIGCLIINSGDQIAHLTNDIYKSALHRVVTTSNQPRYSTAVFTYFNVYTKVGPLSKFINEEMGIYPRYPHRTTLEYFHYKLHESFL